MTQIIHFKESPDLGQFLSERMDSSLLAVVYFMASLAWAKWRKILTITEIMNHSYPTLDIRNHNLTYGQAMELATRVNEFATYDPTRPSFKCCLVYELDPDRNHDDHFHIQVHANTVFAEAQDD